MKCPKCHYLSFEPEPRCRNCGYGLSLSEPDLTLKADEPTGPLADLELRSAPSRAAAVAVRSAEPATVATSGRASAVAAVAVEADAQTRTETQTRTPPPAQSRPRRPRQRPAPTTELPLFVKGMPHDTGSAEPQVPVPAKPQRPLSVQRPTPDPDRRRQRTARVEVELPSTVRLPAGSTDAAPAAREVVRETRSLGSFRRELLQDLERLDRTSDRAGGGQESVRPKRDAEPVAPTERLAAAAIDAGVLGAVALSVVWLTLRWCGLSLGQATTLPFVPLSGFLLLIVLGYLLMFTAAGGQTIGKMRCGLRVVGDPPDDPRTPAASVRQACLRAALAVPSVLVLGAGFVPGLVGEGRAVHDRLSHTRVVRA